MNKTHWKKLTNPNYLGSWCFQPGEEKVVTIREVKQEIVQNQNGKEECTADSYTVIHVFVPPYYQISMYVAWRIWKTFSKLNNFTTLISYLNTIYSFLPSFMTEDPICLMFDILFFFIKSFKYIIFFRALNNRKKTGFTGFTGFFWPFLTIFAHF